jgi:hypothetical protein
MGLDMNIDCHYYSTNQLGQRHARISNIDSWRKAHIIHEWFVRNVQGGVNDMDTYTVTIDQLLQLKADCLKVLYDNTQSNIKEVFPCNNPNLEYSYHSCVYMLEQTCEIVDSCLNKIEMFKQFGEPYNESDLMFVYHSSF